MRITKVRIRLCDAQKGPLAFASVVLDGDYIVYGMRIIVERMVRPSSYIRKRRMCGHGIRSTHTLSGRLVPQRTSVWSRQS